MTDLKRLLASNLWPMLTSESANARLGRFRPKTVSALDVLIESLVLYDQVVVPTQDFLIVRTLLDAFGEDFALALFESGAVRFCRIRGMIALVPSGLVSARIATKSGQPHPFAADLDWTVGWACRELSNAVKSTELSLALTRITTEIDAHDVAESVGSELPLDLSSNPELRRTLDLDAFDPALLPAGKVHLYGGPELPSEIPGVDAFLRAAQCSSELNLAIRNDCDDIAAASHLELMIAAKLARESRTEIGRRALEIADVPDFAPLVRQGALPLSTLLKLRESRDGKAFRVWVHQNLVSSDPVDVARAYTGLLRSTDVVDGTSGRVLRALAWTGITAPAGLVAGGLVGASIGAAAGFAGSIIDSFVVSKVRARASPIVFLDRLRDASSERPSV